VFEHMLLDFLTLMQVNRAATQNFQLPRSGETRIANSSNDKKQRKARSNSTSSNQFNNTEPIVYLGIITRRIIPSNLSYRSWEDYQNSRQ